jgi:hypothetical protein
MHRRLVAPSFLAVAVLLVSGCGTEQAEPADTPAGSASASAAPPATLPPAPEATGGSATTIAAVTLPAAAAGWSSSIGPDAARVIDAFAEPGRAAGVFTDLFALPIDVPLPDDVLLSYARYGLTKSFDGGFDEVWSAWGTTAGAPADVLAAFDSAFSSQSFDAASRTETDMGPYVAVTLTYPPTPEAAAEGWAPLTVTVMPETDATMAETGRSDLRVDLTRRVAELPELSTFVGGWLAEAPVAEGTSPIEVNVEASSQPAPRLTYNVRYEAPADDFDRLVEFYAAERTGGALVYPAVEAPADLSEVEWFSGDPAATLAGYPLTASVERYLPEPDQPVVASLGVTITGG